MAPHAKPVSSLSSSLLARKGHARPAMRSQGFGGFGGVTQGLDDLGWNDMGAADQVTANEPVAEPAVAATPAVAMPVPTVLVEREALKAAIEIPAPGGRVSVTTASRLQRETAHQGKAAFTLRVDADRHLKLRLASAITNRSAQDLVTQALDALIDAVPDVAALVAQLPKAAPGPKR